MRKFLVLFSFVPILLISFFSLGAMTLQQNHQSQTEEKVRTKRSVETGINETDFINTMFLRSSFFENWSDTNYFVNPTLKTSKLLTYNENWYLDFLKDSYATGIVFDKPSDKFLELYKNWDSYVKQYKLNRFYNVDKKQFLKELTNFMYTYALKYDYMTIKEKFKKGIKNLEQVKFNEDNWKLIDINWQKDMYKFENEFKKLNNKWYFFIESDTYGFNKYLAKNNGNNIKEANSWNWILILNNGDYAYFDASKTKLIYCWDGVDEPQIPTINSSTGEITDWKTGSEWSWFYNLIDVVVEENIRVQQGGSANYEKLDFDGTQKIIFDFEIIDEVDKDKIKKVVYRMILTINQHQIIRAGNISLLHYLNDEYDDNELNFSFDFQQSAFDDENLNPLWNFKIENYVYQNKVKYSYEYLEGLIYINDFLKQFFSNALIPMFINRGAFIEASYLNFLTYDTVIVNFLGLKPDNFLSVVKLYNVSNNKIQQEQKDEIDFKLQWKNILNSSFKIMNDFYKNYLRTIFDLENNTYTQGYNKKYGLLANNGFKIYPRYFYFSDKYKKLDFKMYSAYKNRFYNTNYGDAFNYDFSVANNYNINQNEGYVFERTLKDKYGLKYKKMEEQKIGYNVFELQAQKENDIYRYYDFNFGIYNWQEINNGGLFPDSQWWQAQYESCSWYNLACHIRNAAIWIVNNIPGIKQVNELASGVGKIFQTIYSFFNQTFEVWKFSPALYSIITNLFLLIIFMKFVRLI